MHDRLTDPLDERLPPGPGTDPERVASSQFLRLCAAITHGVAEHGYERMTVRGLCALAGVSPKTLYKHFPEGMHECFLGAQEHAALTAGRQLAAAQVGARGPRERLRTGIGAFCEMVAEQPQRAHLLLAEAQHVSAEARAQALRIEAQAAAALAEQLGIAVDPLPVLATGVVAGAVAVAREMLLGGRAAEMPQLAGRLCGWALAVCGEASVLSAAVHGPRPQARYRQEPERLRTMRLDDERGRMLAAAIELLADGDPLRLNIDLLAEHALVPRRRVEVLFGGCNACLLVAIEESMGALFDRAGRRLDAGDRSPFGRVSVMVRELALDRELALAAFTGLPALGAQGVRLRRGLASAFARTVQGAGGAEDGAGAPRLGAAAIWGVIEHRLAAGRALPAPHELACLLAPVAAPSGRQPAAPPSRHVAVAVGA